MSRPTWRCEGCDTHNEIDPEFEPRCIKCNRPRRLRDAVEIMFDGVKRCVNCHEPRPGLACSFCFPGGAA